MPLTTRTAVLTLSFISALAMLYVGAYQVRAIDHLSCPLVRGQGGGNGCEAVADAPFARPGGIPDGFIAAAMYALLIVLALFDPQIAWIRYSLRSVVILAAIANILGIVDMANLGAYCFYCLLTTALAPPLVWAVFRLK